MVWKIWPIWYLYGPYTCMLHIIWQLWMVIIFVIKWTSIVQFFGCDCINYAVINWYWTAGCLRTDWLRNQSKMRRVIRRMCFIYWNLFPKDWVFLQWLVRIGVTFNTYSVLLNHFWLDLAPEKTILTVYCENWEVRKDTG